jgi:hypothetical protein
MVPPQHGAWAFLGLPLVVGIAVAPWTPVLVVLAAAWICAYPWSYFVLALARDSRARHPHPERLRRPLLLWSAVAIPSLLLLVILRPWLVWVGALYALGFAANVGFALRRDDRALVNDVVFILECTALIPVTWAIGAFGQALTAPPLDAVPEQVWILTAAVALLLTGSTLHVKSLIRERANHRFGKVSEGFAIVSLMFSVLLAARWGLLAGLWLVPPFAYALGRSVTMRGTSPRPARIGLVELVAYLLLTVASIVLSRT